MLEERSKRVQYLIAFSVSLAAVTVGCFQSWPAPMMTKLRENTTDIVITDNQISWLVSSSAPGYMVGSLATRFVADRLGRRTCILSSALPATVGTVMVATTTNPWLVCVSRLLWGICMGMVLTVVTLYLAEIVDKEIRGSLSMFTKFMYNFGNLLTMCIAPFVAYKTFNYMILALPVIFLAVCWWIPESPYFLLKESRVKKAKKALKKITACKDEKLLEDELLQLQADVCNEMRNSSSVRELFTGKKYRKAVIIAAGLKLSQVLTGQLVIQEYLGLIMKQSKTTIDLWLLFVIFGVLRFCASLMSSVLADKWGRRPLLIYSYSGASVALIAVGTYFFIIDFVKPDADQIKSFTLIPFTGILISIMLSCVGFHSLMVLVPAEIFPMNVKAIAMTCLHIFAGLFTFFVAKGYQIIKNWTGLCGVFWFFGVAALFGALFTYFYVPETKGKSLRDIQILLQGDLYEADEVLIKLKEIKFDKVIHKNQMKN